MPSHNGSADSIMAHLQQQQDQQNRHQQEQRDQDLRVQQDRDEQKLRDKAQQLLHQRQLRDKAQQLLHQQHQLALFNQWQQQQLRLTTMCKGISIVILQNNIHTITIASDDIEKGFHHLLGNAIRQQATYRSNNSGQWPFGPHVVGFLMDTNSIKSSWQCIQVEGIVGFRKVDKCSQIPAVGQFCCNGCICKKNDFLRLCRAEIKERMYEGGHCGRRLDQMMMKSPTILKNKLKSQAARINSLNAGDRWRRKVVKRLRATQQKIPNIDEDKLLGDEKEWKAKYKEMMSREADVERKEIFEILFDEMAVVRRRRDRHGAHHGHEWSALMIQFCGYVRFGNGASSGMNKNMWNFIAEAFCIPTDRTLMKYSRTDTSSPDGPCLETILQNAELVDKLAPDLNHPMRYGKMSMDSHTVKDMFGTFVKLPLFDSIIIFSKI